MHNIAEPDHPDPCLELLMSLAPNSTSSVGIWEEKEGKMGDKESKRGLGLKKEKGDRKETPIP